MIGIVTRRLSKFINIIILCVRRGYDPRLALLCEIDLDKIPQSTVFAHPLGIVIHKDVLIGENCDIKHNVTIGRKEGKNDLHKKCPTIGNNVKIGAGAIIIGGIIIGDNSRIAAGAIVLDDVPSNTLYVSKFTPLYKNIESTVGFES